MGLFVTDWLSVYTFRVVHTELQGGGRQGLDVLKAVCNGYLQCDVYLI